jgi:hypothetical protein
VKTLKDTGIGNTFLNRTLITQKIRTRVEKRQEKKELKTGIASNKKPKD